MKLLLLLPIACILYAWVVRFFVRNFLAAWFCILVATGLNYTFGQDALMVGTFHIAPLDLLYLCLIPAGIIRVRFHELQFDGLTLLTGGYVFLIFVSAVRGIPLFGLAFVGNECRGFVGEILTLTYFTTIPRDRVTVKKVIIGQLILSAFYLVVCVANYAGLPVGGALGVVNQFVVLTDTRDLDRALPAIPAASIAFSVIFAASWSIYRKHSRWIPISVGLFTLAVIVLQHRSVWAVVLACTLASAFLDGRLFQYLLKVGGSVVLIGALVVLGSSSLRTRLTSDLEESATNSDTLEWRIQVWERSISEDQSPLTFLIGRPFGSSYTRLDSNTGGFTTDIPPHNEYITQYLRVGVLGTILLVLFLLRPIRTYLSTQNAGGLLYPAPSAWVLVTIGLIVYGFPYNYPVELLAFVGMANGLMGVPDRVPHRVTRLGRVQRLGRPAIQLE